MSLPNRKRPKVDSVSFGVAEPESDSECANTAGNEEIQKEREPSLPSQSSVHHSLTAFGTLIHGNVELTEDANLTMDMGHILRNLPQIPTTSNASSTIELKGTEVKKDFTARSLNVNLTPNPNLTNNSNSDSPSSSSVAGNTNSSKRNKCYELKRPGNVLIFNNDFIVKKKSFGAEKYAAFERHGSQQDVDDMVNLFENNLGCIVHVEDNVTSIALPEKLNTFKEACYDADSSFLVIIVMTHGGPGDLLVMHDLKEVNLFEDLIYKFKEDAFPEFKGRPKIFLIQACDNYGPQPDAINRTVGEIADTFVGRACLPLGLSFREPGGPQRGSWYIQSIKDEFSVRWRDEDLQRMHDRVRDSVVEKGRTENLRRPEGDRHHLQTPYYTPFDFGGFKFPLPS